MAGLRKRLGEILVEKGVLSQQVLAQALQIQRESPQKETLGDVLIRKEFCPSREVLSALGNQHGVPTTDFEGEKPPHNLQSIIDAEFAQKHLVLPFREEKKGKSTIYCVAMVKPWDVSLVQDLEFKLKAQVKPHIALAGHIREAIRRYYYSQDYGYTVDYSERRGFQVKAEEAAPAALSAGQLEKINERIEKLEKNLERLTMKMDRLPILAELSPGAPPTGPSARGGFASEEAMARLQVMEKTIEKVVQKIREMMTAAPVPAPVALAAGDGGRIEAFEKALRELRERFDQMPVLQGGNGGAPPEAAAQMEEVRNTFLALVSLLGQNGVVTRGEIQAALKGKPGIPLD
ncbi:MAG: hypothetical protein AB1405_09995 [Bdellovibrionota bacterium]